ncbi:MAG: hypothetical protein KAS23_12595 [Anaerohalosphaera sp.]|nr:hypothetical protein [Anaerohalosphaera sp.]
MALRIKALIIALIILSHAAVIADIEQNRQKFIKFLRSAGMDEQLEAAVTISRDENSLLSIADQGTYFIQYMVLTPQRSCEPNIVSSLDCELPKTAKNMVIVTHGWLDKAADDWPADIAAALSETVDPNEWICGYFDWKGGSQVANPIEAAKYSRDIAGPRLAAAVLSLDHGIEHIHLIAHSAGCWGIDSAAKIIAEKTSADIHLTFLDAYVPPKWPQEDLGDITPQNKQTVFAEQYYTKDITLYVTHKNLTNACNIDLSGIDGGIHGHEFPYRWYYATIAGQYRKKDHESGNDVLTSAGSLNYGFARSKESAQKNWTQSLNLKTKSETIIMKKPKKPKRSFFRKK